jgi:hypothetical protein
MTPVLHVMIVSMISVNANLPSQRQTLARTLECHAPFSRQSHMAKNFKLYTLNITFLNSLNPLFCVTKTSKNPVAFEKILSRIIRALPGTYERI